MKLRTNFTGTYKKDNAYKNHYDHNDNSSDGRKKLFDQMHLKSDSEDGNNKGTKGLRKGFLLNEHRNNRQKLHKDSNSEPEELEIENDSSIGSCRETYLEELEILSESSAESTIYRDLLEIDEDYQFQSKGTQHHMTIEMH